MKIGLQKQSLVDLLRTVLESWRRDSDLSREAVAIHVTEAHDEMRAAAATGITFDSTSKDIYVRAKSASQKLYRWLGGDDDLDAKLPANMLISILGALPMEQRLAFLDQALCPLGIEASSIEDAPAIGFDPIAHLRAIAKESAEGKLALLEVGASSSDEQLLAVRKELSDASQAYQAAADDVTAELTARHAVARASCRST